MGSKTISIDLKEVCKLSLEGLQPREDIDKALFPEKNKSFLDKLLVR
jgi:hypothetical protein